MNSVAHENQRWGTPMTSEVQMSWIICLCRFFFACKETQCFTCSAGEILQENWFYKRWIPPHPRDLVSR
ncbi:hypothetical protein FKM82_029747 [Ascaphus truei]